MRKKPLMNGLVPIGELMADDRQARIKAGHAERLDWPGNRMQLSWEVWGEIRPLRAMWLIDHEQGCFSTKQAYDDFGEAIAYFDTLKRENAVAIAMAALRIGRKR
jgi:hypothetical protein